MSRRVTSNQLASEIMNALKEYKEVTDDVVKQAVNTVSEETKKMVQSCLLYTSPSPRDCS